MATEPESQVKPAYADGSGMSLIPPIDRAFLALSLHHNEQALTELADKYADITEIKDGDKATYQMVVRGGIELMKARTAITATGKAARDDANQFRFAVLAEEKRLISITQPEEMRLKGLRKSYDDEQDRKAQEARQLEQRRIRDITERIAAIKNQTDGLMHADSTAIQMRLDAVASIVCNEALFAEFVDQAAAVKSDTIKTLDILLAARVDLEAHAEENERIAREQAQRQAQLDQQAKEQRERDRAAQDKLRAEQARIDAEAAEIERRKAEEKAAADAKAAAEEEAARQEALRPDKEKLMEWAKQLQAINAPIITDIQLQSYRNSAVERIHGIGEELAGYVEKF
jgi:hypothetical protein